MTTEPRTIWLVTILAHDGSSEVTLRYSDTGFNSKPSDTPASTHFEARVEDPGSMSRTIFAGGTTYGAVEVGYGFLTLRNEDGGVDALRTYGFGRRITVQSITALLPEAEPLSAAVTRLTGIVSHVETDFDLLTVVLRDELGRLATPLQESEFAGTSTGPTGIEGNASVAARVKPMCWGGALWNVPVPLVNYSKEVFGARFDVNGATLPVDSVDALRVKGATYTLSGTDHADEAALFAASVTSSTADTAVAEGLLRTSGTVQGTLTADITVAAEYTNLFENSEDIAGTADDAGSGVSRGNVTITADQHDAPDGAGDMDLVTPSGTSVGHFLYIYRGAINAAAGYRIFTGLFVKALGGRYVTLKVRSDSFAMGGFITVDLSDGSTVATGAMSTGSVIDSNVVDYGDGIYRIEILVDATAASSGVSAVVQFYILDSGQNETHSDATQTLYVWGLQTHVDATEILPYIRSTGSAATLRCHATAARVAAAMLGEHDYTITPASLLALDRKNPAPVAAYFDKPVTILDGVQTVLESIGGYLIGTNTGDLVVGRFEAPAGPVRKAIVESQILDNSRHSIQIVPTDDEGTGIPAFKAILSFSPNWLAQDRDALAGSVSIEDRDLYAQPALLVDDTDAAVLTKHPEARTVRLETLLEDTADAQAEVERRLLFLKSEPSRFRVPLATTEAVWDSDGATPLDIGDEVTLELSRFGYSVAASFVVIGVDELFGESVVVVDIVRSSLW